MVENESTIITIQMCVEQSSPKIQIYGILNNEESKEQLRRDV